VVTFGYLAGAAALAALAVAVTLYNRFVRARQPVQEGWSAIEVQLRRRSALIQNLVESVRGYAEYERGAITQLVEARGALRMAEGPGAAARANAELTAALHAFFAVADAYPALKATERFVRAQVELAETENQIAYARNDYNSAVEAYNNSVQTVLGLVVARAFGFEPAELFSAAHDARDRVTV